MATWDRSRDAARATPVTMARTEAGMLSPYRPGDPTSTAATPSERREPAVAPTGAAAARA